ncbi:MAG: RNA polymerase factor sigma-54 [Paludibacteraceae bacterium]|nr:RNA polymerase factor sigma-54 [Paludibacteraceae bacterium]
MSDFSLIQDQRIRQTLLPNQVQVMRLLEVPACDLAARVHEEMEKNMVLEEGTDPEQQYTQHEDEETYEPDYNESSEPTRDGDGEVFDYSRYADDGDEANYGYADGNDDDDREIPLSAGVSFGEYLKSQVYLTKMDKPQRHIAKFVVGNIDENGYLTRPVSALCDDLLFREGLTVSEEEMLDIVRQIQQFDPPGVGAADLRECLLIQLGQKKQTPVIQSAVRIIRDHFVSLTKHHYDSICEAMDISPDQLKDTLAEIAKLNPKPGSAWQGSVYERHQLAVIPDFYVENQEGRLVLTLNTGDIPTLHISRQYKDMLQDYANAGKNITAKQKEGVQFIKQKIESAEHFIDAIRQRNETLYRTMNAIIHMQHDWFMEGDDICLHPLVLQDVADKTGYDVSTISRVCNSKYVQTEFGIFSLKHFFSEKMVTTDGEEVSTREIKQILSECVAAEDKHNPLTDEALVNMLREKGYTLARRTVAKYREQLNIPAARMRRTL